MSLSKVFIMQTELRKTVGGGGKYKIRIYKKIEIQDLTFIADPVAEPPLARFN